MLKQLISAVALALLIVPTFSIEDRWNTKPIPDDVDSETGIATFGSSSSTPPPPLPCSIQRGFYGEKSQEVTVVEFFYEVEISKTSDKSIEDVIGMIELGVADNVLPSLFPEACPSPTSAVAKARSGDRSRRLEEVTGLSTLPLDSVVTGVDCEITLIDDENPCYIVDSAFSVYSVGESSSIYTSAMNAVQDAVNDGLLTNADIVQMNVVDVNPNAAVTDVAPGNEQRSNGDGSSIAATVYISVSAGVVLIVGAAIMYRRRRMQSNVDADSTIMTPSLPPNKPETETPVYDLNQVA